MNLVETEADGLQIRVHGGTGLPSLIYLPGLHGDWTLIASFRAAVAGRARFVEITYPRTLSWSLEDYAGAVEAALAAHGISRGWLLAESFASQIAWQLLDPSARPPSFERPFRPEGLILAGGFVRYPALWRVVFARRLCHRAPLVGLRTFLRVYAWYARFRHRHAPETGAGIAEFVARRTDLDRHAMAHRLALIAGNDPRVTARGTRHPVFHLTGFWDPVVPGWRVRRWLRRECAGFRAGKTIWNADHNVLSTAPQSAADQVMGWIGTESRAVNSARG